MDDFRTELAAAIAAMTEAGLEPAFLIVDLEGLTAVKQSNDPGALATLRDAASGAISAAGGDCDTFTYGEERVVAILPGFRRLQTFALIDKLRRALPLLGQSFDCALRPEFDVLEYDEASGVAGLVRQLAKLTGERDAA
ncbi:MAG: hypothetical protein IVW36_09285 [Dehalococcoidia bacterium]|nr:hypothetical protein [Dehalococcoidia bacterium]